MKARILKRLEDEVGGARPRAADGAAQGDPAGPRTGRPERERRVPGREGAPVLRAGAHGHAAQADGRDLADEPRPAAHRPRGVRLDRASSRTATGRRISLPAGDARRRRRDEGADFDQFAHRQGDRRQAGRRRDHRADADRRPPVRTDQAHPRFTTRPDGRARALLPNAPHGPGADRHRDRRGLSRRRAAGAGRGRRPDRHRRRARHRRRRRLLHGHRRRPGSGARTGSGGSAGVPASTPGGRRCARWAGRPAAALLVLVPLAGAGGRRSCYPAALLLLSAPRPRAGRALADGYAALVHDAFQPGRLPTWVPRAALLLAAAVLAVWPSRPRARAMRGPDTASAGAFWWRVFGAPHQPALRHRVLADGALAPDDRRRHAFPEPESGRTLAALCRGAGRQPGPAGIPRTDRRSCTTWTRVATWCWRR